MAYRSYKLKRALGLFGRVMRVFQLVNRMDTMHQGKGRFELYFRYCAFSASEEFDIQSTLAVEYRTFDMLSLLMR
jgi:hypothetical protein